MDLTNTSHLIIMVVMDTMDTTEITDSTDGWVIPGIGGADMVIGEAGTTVTLVGGGIPGTAILGGGGTEIIGGAGYPTGAPSLVRTDPTTIFLFFYERKIILMTFDTVIVVRPNIVIITAIARRLKHRKEGQHFSDSVKEKILEKHHHRCADCNRVLNVVD